MSVEEAPAAKPPRRFLLWAAAAVVLLVFLASSWTLFWRFAAGQSEETITAWIDREKGFGRIWSCPARTIGGFPFAIEIACTKPRFDGVIFGRHFSGGLNDFHATALLFHPSVVTARLGSPFAVLSDDRTTNLELAWHGLELVLDGLPQNVWRVSISGHKLAWRGALQGLGAVTGRAHRLVADAMAHPDQTDRAYDFNVAVSAATLPDLDRFLGAALPTDIDAQGTVTKAIFDLAPTVAQNMETWRAAGGRLDLGEASLTHGDTKFTARGSLRLDDLHRVQGRLDTQSRGLEPFLLQLGVNPVLVSAGTLLSSLITGAPPSSADTPPETLVVPIGFDDGRLSIGPARTSIRLPPLY
jgi:hypothetical protein